MDWAINSNELHSLCNKIIKESQDKNEKILAQNNDIVKLLIDDTNQTTMYHNAISFLQYVSPSKEIRNVSHECDIIISTYIMNLNNNQELYNKILSIKNSQDQIFIDALIKFYKRSGINKDITKIKHKIIDCENTIDMFINESVSVLPIHKSALDGIPDFFKLESKDNYYKLPLDRYHYDICMKYVNNKDARKQIELAYINKYRPIIPKIVKLAIYRNKFAELLGYASYADYIAETKMAKTSGNVYKFLENTSSKLNNKYKSEFDKLELLSKDTTIGTWDIPYFFNIYKYRYGLDENLIREYFEFSKVIPKMIDIYKKIFSIDFNKINVKTWDESVDVYEISYNFPQGNISQPDTSFQSHKKTILGKLYLDLKFREHKNKHIRCFTMIPSSEKYTSEIALVANIDDTLLNYHDVIKLFKELAHVIQLLFNNSKYAIFSAANIEYDYIEVPAIIFELLCVDGDILMQLSEHYKTGKQLDELIMHKISNIKNMNIAFNCKKQIALSLFDQFMFSPKNILLANISYDGVSDEDILNKLSQLYKKIYGNVMSEKNLNIKNMTNIQTMNSYYPYEWIHEMTTNGGSYYSYLWAYILAIDIYCEKIKSGKSFGEDIINYLFKDAGTKNMYDAISEYIGRKPIIDTFIKYHELDKDMTYSFYKLSPSIANDNPEKNNYENLYKQKESKELKEPNKSIYNVTHSTNNHFSEVSVDYYGNIDIISEYR